MSFCTRFSRQFFSTETAVLKVVSDVLMAMNEDQITHLGMFDLSAAFDTVDHAIMLKRLDVSFGIRGNALNWFVSYLSGKSFWHRQLEFGMPQGTVLGRVLFFFTLQILLHWCRAFVF